ncbi:P-loop containing nucleoside triphosphate hydrolase protein, partial [Pterulicium gracile]
MLDDLSNFQIRMETVLGSPRGPASTAPPRCPSASLNFVGREEEHKIIWNFFFGPEVQLDERRIFSIVGIGGCGKTQLARRFMKAVYRRFSDKRQAHLVFYIDGTTQATIEASLVSIAKANGLDESSEASLAWMSNLDTEFFMYIDNADDPTINMRGFFSNSDYVRVIITTRLSEKAHHYSQGDGSILILRSLSEEESIKLLAKTARLSEEAVVRDGSLIAMLLCYLPLAIAQAGACISKSGWTVHLYLEKFHSLRALLLDGRNDQVEATAIDDYPLHFYTTWKLSYDILPKRAQALLRLCSYLHHTGITEQLFHDAYRGISNEIFASPSILFSSHEQSAYVNARDFLNQFVRDEGWSTEDFAWCMREACSTSILSLEGTEHYSIHPLVHSCLHGVEKESTTTAFVLAASIISTGEVTWARLVNHMQHLLTYHSDTLSAMGNLANTLHELGRYNKAELMQREVLDKRQRGLGTDHPYTISAMGNLASTLHQLGLYDKAELMQREVLEKRQRGLGPDHPDTILAMGNLANTLRELGQYNRAELMEREVLENRQRGVGPDHPDTISALGNLASTLYKLGQYDKAELMLREMLEKGQRGLGSDHPYTILAMGNLASTLCELGRYNEAE